MDRVAGCRACESLAAVFTNRSTFVTIMLTVELARYDGAAIAVIMNNKRQPSSVRGIRLPLATQSRTIEILPGDHSSN